MIKDVFAEKKLKRRKANVNESNNPRKIVRVRGCSCIGNPVWMMACPN